MHGSGSDLERQAARLMARAGLSAPQRLEPLRGGRNNRVFAVHAPEGVFFLKAYFRHPGDPRDRLHAEFSFLEYAWARGLRTIPRPLARDDASGLGLYTFLEGRLLAPGEVTAAHVEAAARFYVGLNPADGPASGLPDGSEACFSLAAHLECVAQRVGRLADAATGPDFRPDAAAFVLDNLAPVWETWRDGTRDAAARLGLSMNAALPPALRRVSPSDFGFHNALLGRNGDLFFVDFEYAGMDDPAKTVCDFFCQPDVPASPAALPDFLRRVCGNSPDDADLPARVELLLPVYRLKWCCIMLNEFLPVSAARREFAEGGARARRDRQLALAKQTLLQLR